MHIDAAAILVNALKHVSEVIALSVVGLQQNLPNAIPRCDDLKLRLISNHLAGTVERNALIHNHADINGTCAAFIESFKEL
jgi:hypothetical protein